MNVPALKLVLRPILTVTSVQNTGETGDRQPDNAYTFCPNSM